MRTTRRSHIAERPLLVASLLTYALSCEGARTSVETSRAKPAVETNPAKPAVETNRAKPAAPKATQDLRENETPVYSADARPSAGGNSQASAAPAIVHADAPEQVATTWLEAVRSRDFPTAAKLTALPFTLRDRDVANPCLTPVARHPNELVATLTCIGANELLIEDLNSTENRPYEISKIADTHLPSWAKTYRKGTSSSLVAVGLELQGNGVFHSIILLVGPDGVHEFWRRASYDGG